MMESVLQFNNGIETAPTRTLKVRKLTIPTPCFIEIQMSDENTSWTRYVMFDSSDTYIQSRLVFRAGVKYRFHSIPPIPTILAFGAVL